MGINTQGEIVGFADTPEGLIHVVLWNNGKIVGIGTNLTGNSLAIAINDQGWILVVNETQGFLYHPPKGFLDIAMGLNQENDTIVPIGFNQKGEVLGISLHLTEDTEDRTTIIKFPFIFSPDKGKPVILPHWPIVRD